MRGLIIKDLLFLKSTWKNLLLMFAGSLMISIAAGNYTLAITVLPLMLITSGITTFQTDEFYNTDAYQLTYPLNRKQIVSAKFLFTLLMVAFSTYLGFMIYTIINFTISPGLAGLNPDMLKYLLMLELASLLVDSVFYPIIYKYGCEKSRFVLLSIIMVLIGALSLLSVSINVFDIIKIDWEKVVEFIQNNGLWILSIIVVFAIALSYFLSILFYKKKDY